MTNKQLDKAEEAADARASAAAYLCSEKCTPETKDNVYKTMYSYISTGIHFMREELEHINNSKR